MRILLLLLGVSFLYSCDQSAISSQLSGSDSLVIHFNEPGSNMISKSVTTSESNAIRRLSQFVDKKESEKYNCGYDGNMIFYVKGKEKADISFQYNIDSCRHFIFSMNGELHATKMNEEAADLLRSLSEGKTWY